MSRDSEPLASDPPTEGGECPTDPARKRIRLLNAGAHASGQDLMPLAACDCDNHTHCHVHTDVCVADEVDTDVEVDACGIWG